MPQRFEGVFEGDLSGDHDGCRVRQLLHSGPGGADECPRPLIDDELARIRRALAECVGTGHVAGRVLHRAPGESLVARLLLGAAHGTDLRVGEGHTRDDVVAGDVGGVPSEYDVWPDAQAIIAAYQRIAALT